MGDKRPFLAELAHKPSERGRAKLWLSSWAQAARRFLVWCVFQFDEDDVRISVTDILSMVILGVEPSRLPCFNFNVN